MTDHAMQALTPGDRVRNFFLTCQTGEVISLYDKALGGEIVVLLTSSVRSAQATQCLGDACALQVGRNGNPFHLIVITRDSQPVVAEVAQRAELQGWFLCEEGDIAAAAFGCDWQSTGAGVHVFVLDANQRVIEHIAPGAEDPVREAARVLASLPRVEPREVSHIAPALIVPRVLEPAFCRHLIDTFHTGGHEEGGVYTLKEGDLVHQVDDTIKKRRDHYVRDPQLGAAIAERLMRRVLPEIHKAYHYRVTAAEEYKVVRYRDEEGGFFGAHRDDMTPQTAHRRFAMTLNLNDDFEGGHLRFPEYGPHLYRPGGGEAVVFSCSLLHAVSPVTRGDRFVLLAFLYGEDGKQQRREMDELMAQAAGKGRR